MREFFFAEMKEHAKQLEIYCRLFEDLQTRVNLNTEFTQTMRGDGAQITD